MGAGGGGLDEPSSTSNWSSESKSAVDFDCRFGCCMWRRSCMELWRSNDFLNDWRYLSSLYNEVADVGLSFKFLLESRPSKTPKFFFNFVISSENFLSSSCNDMSWCFGDANGPEGFTRRVKKLLSSFFIVWKCLKFAFKSAFNSSSWFLLSKFVKFSILRISSIMSWIDWSSDWLDWSCKCCCCNCCWCFFFFPFDFFWLDFSCAVDSAPESAPFFSEIDSVFSVNGDASFASSFSSLSSKIMSSEECPGVGSVGMVLKRFLFNSPLRKKSTPVLNCSSLKFFSSSMAFCCCKRCWFIASRCSSGALLSMRFRKNWKFCDVGWVPSIANNAS